MKNVARFATPTGSSARFILRNLAIVNSVVIYSLNLLRLALLSPELMGLVVLGVKEFSVPDPVWLRIAVHASPLLIKNPPVILLIPC